ncbi:unnamed protein product [Medioppia subpectinata]|uniref:Uncharacterized protein n=1 Tax=Medioppia subpectinata TaxID=1979941 RepID=A0A7R9LY10_9ACAR|nr:unnamed protein product [Medioppia subpectinata]CAG2122429.1 unnamed protein product [Medioppia subpectinata]
MIMAKKLRSNSVIYRSERKSI